MSGHTPGPWSVAPRIGRYQVIPATEQERYKLASINALEFEALSVGTPKGQMAMIPLDESNPANANLIAAAPDLLEALEAFERIKDIWLPAEAEEQHAEEMHTLHMARNSMIAAIAKAKGESQ